MQLQNRRRSRQQQEPDQPEFVEGELVVHLSSDNAEEGEEGEEEEENKSLTRRPAEERSQEGDTIEICHSLNHKSE